MRVKPVVSVCVCTFRRPDHLARTLRSVFAQELDAAVEIIVVDNDPERSAGPVLEASGGDVPLRHFFEPTPNIALARNRCVAEAAGDWIAFIDDDELASTTWLKSLLRTAYAYGADVVVGPVLPTLEDDAPRWMRGSKLFERPRRVTGTPAADLAVTGNCLIRAALLGSRRALALDAPLTHAPGGLRTDPAPGGARTGEVRRDPAIPGPFDPELGRIGGSDTELFLDLAARGTRIVWCDEAEVCESIGPERGRLRWHFRRGYRSGWTWARRRRRRHPSMAGALGMCARAAGGLAKSAGEALLAARRPHDATYMLARGGSAFVGKLGFLLGRSVEEYGGAPEHAPQQESPPRTVPPRPNQERIRTLIIHPGLAPYRIDLFNRLAERLDLRIVFAPGPVAYHPELDQESLQSSLVADARIHRLTHSIGGTHLPVGIGRHIRDFEPQVVVSSDFGYATLACLRHRERRGDFGAVVWTAENPRTFAARGAVRRRIRASAWRRADSVLVYTEAMRECVTRHTGRERDVFLCSNLQSEVALARKLEQGAPFARRYARELGLEGKKVVLFVGRLAACKNLGRLLEAHARVAMARNDAALVLVGDGPERSRLQAAARRAGLDGRIVFAGHREGAELYGWYGVADLLVLPSTHEPFGAVVGEALLAGVPVICSAHAGASALIHSSRAGEVIDPLDASALAAVLRRWLDALPNGTRPPAGSLRASLLQRRFSDEVDGFVEACTVAARNRLSRGTVEGRA